MQVVDSAAPDSQFGAITVISGLVDGPHTASIYPVSGVIAPDAFGVEALPDVTPTSTLLPTDIPTQDVTPTELPPDLPTQTPTAPPTLLPVTLPFVEPFDSGLNWLPTDAWTFDTQTCAGYRHRPGEAWLVKQHTGSYSEGHSKQEFDVKSRSLVEGRRQKAAT